MDEFSNLRLKIKIYGGKKVKKNQKLIQAYWRLAFVSGNLLQGGNPEVN